MNKLSLNFILNEFRTLLTLNKPLPEEKEAFEQKQLDRCHSHIRASLSLFPLGSDSAHCRAPHICLPEIQTALDQTSAFKVMNIPFFQVTEEIVKTGFMLAYQFRRKYPFLCKQAVQEEVGSCGGRIPGGTCHG